MEFEGSKYLPLQIHNKDRPAASCLSFGKKDEVRDWKIHGHARNWESGPSPRVARVLIVLWANFPLSRRSC